MSAEEWRPIPGYGGYEASSRGQIRSFRSDPEGRVLVATVNAAGYPALNLRADTGRRVTKTVHNLVTLTFLGERPDGLMTRHLDGNPLNNDVTNLRYGTSAENHVDAVRHGTHFQASKTRCKRGHEFTPENTRLEQRTGGGQQRRCLSCERARYAA